MAQTKSAALTAPATSYSKSKSFTIAAHIARVILGLIFFVFGLNKFLQFISMPAPAGLAGEFMFGLSKAPYMFPLLGLIEVFAGALLLSGRLVPFALLLLFPINLNILLFHLSLAPENIGMGIFMMAAHILLAVYYWPAYKQIFNTGNAWRNNHDSNETKIF